MSTFSFFAKDLLSKNLKQFDAQEVEQEETARYSYLGTPVFSNIEIPKGIYIDNKGNTINFDGIRFDTALIDVTIEKNIVRTAINGLNGTVKQFISLGDYSVNVQAIIIGQTDANNSGFEVAATDRVPESEIRKLNKILQVPQEIEIISEFLDFFDISTVVMTGGNVSQREGYRDSVFANFGLLSDTPIELK